MVRVFPQSGNFIYRFAFAGGAFPDPSIPFLWKTFLDAAG